MNKKYTSIFKESRNDFLDFTSNLPKQAIVEISNIEDKSFSILGLKNLKIKAKVYYDEINETVLFKTAIGSFNIEPLNENETHWKIVKDSPRKYIFYTKSGLFAVSVIF